MGDFQLPGVKVDSRRIPKPIQKSPPRGPRGPGWAPGHERIDAWGTVICRVRALGGTGAVVEPG
jgi:hypothetical protein